MKTVGHVVANNFRRRHAWRLMCCCAAVVCVVVCLFRFAPPHLRRSYDVWWKDGQTPADNAKTTQLPTSFSLHPQSYESSPPPPPPPRRTTPPYVKQLQQRMEIRKNLLMTSGVPPPQVLEGSRCSDDPERPFENMTESFEWQRVTPGQDDTFVFSAHYDMRGNRASVVITGISSDYMGSSPAYMCRVWFASSAKAEVCSAERTAHTENHARRYAAVFFTCHFEGHEDIPYAVSLVRPDKRCQSAGNVLKISSPKTPKVNFTVCVTPLNFDFDHSNHLVETIELNRMFGAQRFFFYNHTTGSNVARYMRMYEEEGIVHVIPWKIPVLTDDLRTKVEPQIHYFGQLAALNECLMRNRFQSNFVAFTDLDELIVPRRHGSWEEMATELIRSRSMSGLGQVASLHFRNAFFRTDYEKDSVYEKNATVVGLGLRSLLTTVREQNIYPHGWRSKHIVVPDAVRFVGIHHIERLSDHSPTASVVDVDEATGLLHHYRSWATEETSRQATATDRFMHRFTDQILDRVNAAHSRAAKRKADANQGIS